MKCIHCYRVINDNIKFCKYCGTMQPLDMEAYVREHPEFANAISEDELNQMIESNSSEGVKQQSTSFDVTESPEQPLVQQQESHDNSVTIPTSDTSKKSQQEEALLTLKKFSKIKSWHLALYVILLVIVIGVMLSLRNCGKEPTVITAMNRVDKPSGGDTIDIAIEYSPLSYYTYGDTIGGFNYELLKLVAQKAGLMFKFHPLSKLDAGLDGLEKEVYDILAMQFPVTKDNKDKFLFTKAIYLDKQVLVQRNTGGLAIRSQLDMAGDTVNIVKGSPMRDRIMSLSREIGDTIYVISDPDYGPEQLFMMVATGDIKYAVINETIARKMAASHPNVDISQAISLSQFQSFVLKKTKDNEKLRDTLDKYILEIQELPEYDELIKKYFYQ